MEYVVGLNLVKSFFPSRQAVKRINFRIRICRPLPYTVERLFEDNTGDAQFGLSARKERVEE